MGIANADLTELTYVASEPKCMRTYLLDSFGALSNGNIEVQIELNIDSYHTLSRLPGGADGPDVPVEREVGGR